MKKISYRSNLAAGIASILAGIVLLFVIPSQIGEEYSRTYGITSKTVPYAVAVLWFVCGGLLIVQSLVFHKDTVKELALGKEAKAALYMAVLVAYMYAFPHSFLISTSILGVITLAFTGVRKAHYYLIAVATVAVLYVLFQFVMRVKLP